MEYHVAFALPTDTARQFVSALAGVFATLLWGQVGEGRQCFALLSHLATLETGDGSLQLPLRAGGLL